MPRAVSPRVVRRATGLVLGAVVMVSSALPASLEAAALPEAPRSRVNTTYVRPTGRTIAVSAGDSLQAALNAAAPGDVITLQAGATFTGPFTLPNKSGSGWITVRTSTPDSSLPPPGTRITPAQSGLLPRLVGPNGSPAVQTAAGAHHYRFIGIEFRPSSGSYSTGLVLLGSSGATDAGSQAHHIIIDRCIVRGDPGRGGKRGVALNAGEAAIVDSYLFDWKDGSQDTQAIGGWNGPGPYRIENNYLEAAGENVMFGGADPAIRNLVPSDIEILRNHFAKPRSWNPRDPSYRSPHWAVKNLLELKNARRVLIEGNLFERNWEDAQNGTAILFSPRNQNGGAPWSAVQDVAFVNNVVRDVGNVIKLAGHDDSRPSQQSRRILIANNVFDNVGGGVWGGLGRLYVLLHGSADVTIAHNTGFQSGEAIMAEGDPTTGLVYRDNIAPGPIKGTGTAAGIGTLNAYFPGAVVRRNVFVGGSASAYPADNFFPSSMSAVGIADRSGGDYGLASSSPYRGDATDGKDVGVDMDALAAAMDGADGDDDPPSSPPSDSQPPAVTITAPENRAIVSGTVDVRASASDNVGITLLRLLVDGALVGTWSSPSASYPLDTRTLADGTRTLVVTARDAAGNTGQASIEVTVRNTVSGPAAAAILSPPSGAQIEDFPLEVAVEASDPAGIKRIQLYLDGKRVGKLGCRGRTPCTGTLRLGAKRITRGPHTLSLEAEKIGGGMLYSSPVAVVR